MKVGSLFCSWSLSSSSRTPIFSFTLWFSETCSSYDPAEKQNVVLKTGSNVLGFLINIINMAVFTSVPYFGWKKPCCHWCLWWWWRRRWWLCCQRSSLSGPELSPPPHTGSWIPGPGCLSYSGSHLREPVTESGRQGVTSEPSTDSSSRQPTKAQWKTRGKQKHRPVMLSISKAEWSWIREYLSSPLAVLGSSASVALTSTTLVPGDERKHKKASAPFP